MARTAAAGRHSTGGETGQALLALALANLRYWPTVAPVVRRELGRWQSQAAGIGEVQLRVLAAQKLGDEFFNAEVAATLATLAPGATRAIATRAIVSLELLFDYLDGRTELPVSDPIGEGERLFAPFIQAVCEPQSPGARAGAHGEEKPDTPDGEYLWALSAQTRDGLFSLPAGEAVAGVARAAATRCAQAQTRLHAAASLGDRQVEQWARGSAESSGLGWREYVGGCASSVLSLHALIAAAAEVGTTAEDAERIDAAYLAIGGVITILDSLVDERSDSARGEPGFTRLFDSSEQLSEHLLSLAREAHARARAAPNGGHHVMTLAGVIAYYTTHPGAQEGDVREISLMLRRELAPTIWPTVAVMGGWRAAKSVRRSVRGLGRDRPGAGRGSDT